jgi:hypothetical protein
MYWTAHRCSVNEVFSLIRKISGIVNTRGIFPLASLYWTSPIAQMYWLVPSPPVFGSVSKCSRRALIRAVWFFFYSRLSSVLHSTDLNAERSVRMCLISYSSGAEVRRMIVWSQGQSHSGFLISIRCGPSIGIASQLPLGKDRTDCQGMVTCGSWVPTRDIYIRIPPEEYPIGQVEHRHLG